MSDLDHFNSIIKYWRSIEVFNLPDFVLGQSDNDRYSKLDFAKGAPWLRGNVATKPTHELLYTLVLGVVSKKQVFKTIESYFSVDERLKDEEYDFVNGQTLLCSISISQQGLVKAFGYLLPSYIFGIQLLKDKRPLDQVNKLVDEQSGQFFKRNQIISEESQSVEENNTASAPFTYERLKEEIGQLRKLIAFWFDGEIEVYVNIREVRKDRETDPPFLNSFYLDDLNKVLNQKKERINPIISKLLSEEIDQSKCVDILNSRKAFLEVINPKNLNYGRWPNSLNYNLYHAQLGAVQKIFHEIGNGGLFSVNGPPGTGKTTLLKEVIANVIVKRADLILEVGVSNIFHKKANKIPSKSSNFVSYYHELDSRFLGEFGIVVTSNNNTAVENISKELPKRDQNSYAAEVGAGYFSEISDRLVSGQQSWGTLAAVLGNAKNRYKFVDNFWYDDKNDGSRIGFSKFLRETVRPKNEEDEQYFQKEFALEEANYRALKSTFAAFKNVAESYVVLLGQYQQNLDLIEQLDRKELQIEQDIAANQFAIDSKSKSLDNLASDRGNVKDSLHYLSMNKPTMFFIQKLFKTRAYKEWNDQYQIPLRELLEINQNINLLEKEIKDLKAEHTRFQQAQHDIGKQKEKPKQYFVDFDNKKNTLLTSYAIDPSNLPQEGYFSESISDLHLSMPFYSVKVAQIQSDIFLSALRIHELTVKINEGIISKNLRTFIGSLVSGPDPDHRLMQHLWDSFFICIPVVSTTLASISKQFSFDLKLGWTLIDEAGQAVSQSAVGILQRTKRAVIIGDPLQIEPVVIIPPSLVEKLRKEYNVDLIWSPYVSSLQQLADRTNVLGTKIIDHNDIPVWTGFPLRVHRRCQEPMFSISNKIAYNNQMVLFPGLKTNVNESNEGIQTQWLDVNTDQLALNKHVILAEIDLVERFFTANSEIIGKEDVYIISPFKNIADYCSKHFGSPRFPNVKCGTVHTFQGKEAKTVIFILGTDQNGGGARKWASQKPNLVNVAITRAKNNLIVVGNRDLWKKQPYFSTLYSEVT